MKELEFSLERIELPVKIGGEQYILREADGGASTEYQNRQFACRVFTAEGAYAGTRGMANLIPFLVSRTLFKVTDAGEQAVSEPIIKSWPAKVQEALFLKAKEISDVGQDNSSEKDALLKALQLPNAPIGLAAFTLWAKSLDGKDFAPLREMVRDGEEIAKNSLASMTVGSP